MLHTALDYAQNKFSTSSEEDKDSDYTLAHQLYKEFTNKILYHDISVSEICSSRVYYIMCNSTISSANCRMLTSF